MEKILISASWEETNLSMESDEEEEEEMNEEVERKRLTNASQWNQIQNV